MRSFSLQPSTSLPPFRWLVGRLQYLDFSQYCCPSYETPTLVSAKTFFSLNIPAFPGRTAANASLYEAIAALEIFKQAKDGVLRSIRETFSECWDFRRNFLNAACQPKRIIDKLEAINKLKEYKNDAAMVLYNTKEDCIAEVAVEAIRELQKNIDESDGSSTNTTTTLAASGTSNRDETRTRQKEVANVALEVLYTNKTPISVDDLKNLAGNIDSNASNISSILDLIDLNNQATVDALFDHILSKVSDVTSEMFSVIGDLLERFRKLREAELDAKWEDVKAKWEAEWEAKWKAVREEVKAECWARWDEEWEESNAKRKAKEEWESKQEVGIKISSERAKHLLKYVRRYEFCDILRITNIADLRDHNKIISMIDVLEQDNAVADQDEATIKQGKTQYLYGAIIHELRKKRQTIDANCIRYLLEHANDSPHFVIEMADVKLLTDKDIIRSFFEAFGPNNARNLHSAMMGKLKDNGQTINIECARVLLKYGGVYCKDILKMMNIADLTDCNKIISMIDAVGDAQWLCETVIEVLEKYNEALEATKKKKIKIECAELLLKYVVSFKFKNILNLKDTDVSLADKDTIRRLFGAVAQDRDERVKGELYENVVAKLISDQQKINDAECAKLLLQYCPKKWDYIQDIAKIIDLTNEKMIISLLKAIDQNKDMACDVSKAAINELISKHQKISTECAKCLLNYADTQSFWAILEITNADVDLTDQETILSLFKATIPDERILCKAVVDKLIKTPDRKISVDCALCLLKPLIRIRPYGWWDESYGRYVRNLKKIVQFDGSEKSKQIQFFFKCALTGSHSDLEKLERKIKKFENGNLTENESETESESDEEEEAAREEARRRAEEAARRRAEEAARKSTQLATEEIKLFHCKILEDPAKAKHLMKISEFLGCKNMMSLE